jgi:hypothetical protein
LTFLGLQKKNGSLVSNGCGLGRALCSVELRAETAQHRIMAGYCGKLVIEEREKQRKKAKGEEDVANPVASRRRACVYFQPLLAAV